MMSKKISYLGGSTIMRVQFHKFEGLPPSQRVGFLESTAPVNPNDFPRKTVVIKASKVRLTAKVCPKNLRLEQQALLRRRNEEKKAERRAKRLLSVKPLDISKSEYAQTKRMDNVVVERRPLVSTDTK